VKFRKISRHCYPQIVTYIIHSVASRRCCITVTNNTSKYKEFILTCNTKTQAINDENIVKNVPISFTHVMSFSYHNAHNYHKSKLTTRSEDPKLIRFTYAHGTSTSGTD